MPGPARTATVLRIAPRAPARVVVLRPAPRATFQRVTAPRPVLTLRPVPKLPAADPPRVEPEREWVEPGPAAQRGPLVAHAAEPDEPRAAPLLDEPEREWVEVAPTAPRAPRVLHETEPEDAAVLPPLETDRDWPAEPGPAMRRVPAALEVSGADAPPVARADAGLAFEVVFLPPRVQEQHELPYHEPAFDEVAALARPARPLGVAVLGALGMASGVLLLAGYVVLATFLPAQTRLALEQGAYVLGFPFFGASASFVVGRGLWRGRAGAREVAVALGVVGMAVSLAALAGVAWLARRGDIDPRDLAFVQWAGIGAALLYLALNAVVVWYLSHARVQAWFHHGPAR